MQSDVQASGHAAGLPAKLRRLLRRHEQLAQTVRAGRALIHFGPWRHTARAVIRVLRPPVVSEAPSTSLLQHISPGAVAEAVRAESVCVAGQLPPRRLASIRAVTDTLPAGHYARFHEQNDDIASIVHDEGVLAVVRTYFGAEPELLECTVVVHHADDDLRRPLNAQRYFHFDYAGWQSLNLFVYLTDVPDDSGAHQVVTGTHGAKNLRDAIRAWIPDEEITNRFSNRVRTIYGPAGTMFFEDTEALHRRRAAQRRRVMLNALFASHRGMFSRGRLARPYATYLESRKRRA